MLYSFLIGALNYDFTEQSFDSVKSAITSVKRRSEAVHSRVAYVLHKIVKHLVESAVVHLVEEQYITGS
jgi:hypothetical protein